MVNRSITVDGTVATTPGGFSSWQVTTEAPTSSQAEIMSTPLASRLQLVVQNVGNQDVYLRGLTGVTTANGFLLPKGSSFEACLDDVAKNTLPSCFAHPSVSIKPFKSSFLTLIEL